MVNDSRVSALRNPSDPNIPTTYAQGAFLAKTTDPNIGVNAGYGFGEYLYWYDETLPAFSFDYDFYGETDSEFDSIAFIMQVRISLYADYMEEGQWRWAEVTILNDYDSSALSYNPVHYDAVGADQVIDEVGTRSYASYSAWDYLTSGPEYSNCRWFESAYISVKSSTAMIYAA